MVSELALKYKLTSSSFADLYRRIDLLLHENKEKLVYNYSGCGMGKGFMDFRIQVKKPNELPKELTDLFFNNIDLNYKVECQKIDGVWADDENAYEFTIHNKK